jgi:hypothetical protein
MIVLPVIIVCKNLLDKTTLFLYLSKCVWWQKSARYAGDHILIDTSHLYWVFLSKTSTIIIKRKIDIK